MKAKHYIYGNILIFFFLNCTTSSGQKKGMLSFVFDPKMAIHGPYDHSKNGELDYIIRVACGSNRYEVGLFTEQFQAIHYHGYGMFYNYKFFLKSKSKDFIRWELPVGTDVGFITRTRNDQIFEFSFALNAGLRYYFAKHWGVECLSSYRYRSDFYEVYRVDNTMKFSFYTGLLYRW